MTALAERINKEIQIVDYYDTLKRLSNEMSAGGLDAFAELKTILAPDENDPVRENEITLEDLSEFNTPPIVLGSLYGARKITQDLWFNFGEGNTGFSPDSAPLVKSIAVAMGNLIREGVVEHDKSESRPMSRLGEVVALYEKLIKETELKGQTSDGLGWMVL